MTRHEVMKRAVSAPSSPILEKCHLLHFCWITTKTVVEWAEIQNQIIEVEEKKTANKVASKMSVYEDFDDLMN